MLLSVCIVNWNTVGPLCDCLRALQQFPPANAMCEVIVVDNASSDGSADRVRADFPSVTLVTSDVNLGYAEGNNLAVQRASGDYLLLLNPDVCVHANALTNALSFAEGHPKAGAIGARLVGTDGQTQSTLRSFPDPLPVLWEYMGLARLLPRPYGAYRQTFWNYDKPGETDQPMGSFLLIRRAAWEDVGPFDKQFPIFFNEVDWCWRAKREHGWQIWYTPSAVATHLGGASTRQVKPQMVRESHQSLLRFYEKHYKGRIFPLLYALITRAVRWNEWRLLQGRVS